MKYRFLAILLALFALSCSPNQDSKSVSKVPDSTKKTESVKKEESSNKTAPKEEFPKSFSGDLKSDPEQWLSEEEILEGWLSLFDGQTLFGWRATSNANWEVKDGVITADSGDPGFLMTPYQLKNYQFQCEFRLSKEGNSGIFLRTQMNPTDPSKDCYEFNLCDSHEQFPTGSLVARKKVEVPPVAEDQWRKVRIKLENSTLTAEIDGKEILSFEEAEGSQLGAGHIGLQMNGGKIEFRKIALLPLGEKKIFNQKDLTGWNVVPGSKSKFTVKEGLLNVENGTGFLETEEEWDDFILNVEARTNGDDLNGGLFYRAVKGTEEAPSHGYELQIHHGFADGDRRKPNDYQTGYGTGAIFRRTKVRWVVPNDREWFRMTLLAQGPSFYTWVDGLQVVDFTDTRKKDNNPRKGMKVDPGHISIQGHDETTNVDFREIGIISLKE